MGREFLGGLATAWRYKATSLSVAAMIGFIGVVLSLVLLDVLSQTAAIRGSHELRDHHATVFTAYYHEDAPTPLPEGARTPLIEAINSSQAYTMILGNLEINDPSFADGNRVIAVFGEASSLSAPGLALCSPAPCAMLGSHISSLSRPLELASAEIPVVSRMPGDAAIYDPSAAGVPLAETVLLVLPPEMLPSLDAMEQEEATSRAVFVDDGNRLVDDYVAAAREGGISLAPKRLAVDQPENYRQLMVRSSAYILSLGAFAALVLIAYSRSIDASLERERANLELRYVYGATPAHLAVRIASFLGATMLALPMAALGPGSLSREPLATACRISLLIILLVYLFFIIRALRRINHSPIAPSPGR